MMFNALSDANILLEKRVMNVTNVTATTKDKEGISIKCTK